MAARTVLPRAQLFADALEDQHIGVNSHADGQDDAGDAGQGQRGVKTGQYRHDEEHVEQEGAVGDQPGGAVVEDHEDHD